MCELSETSSPTPETHLPVSARRPRCSLISQVHYGYGGDRLSSSLNRIVSTSWCDGPGGGAGGAGQEESWSKG